VSHLHRHGPRSGNCFHSFHTSCACLTFLSPRCRECVRLLVFFSLTVQICIGYVSQLVSYRLLPSAPNHNDSDCSINRWLRLLLMCIPLFHT
jgi:hypothetical protein